MSRDPIEEEEGYNLYGYVENDPIYDSDELGLFPARAAAEAIKAALKYCAKNSKGISDATKKMMKEAAKEYPKKANKTELHHIVPKYLGAPNNSPKVQIPAPYHQKITNEFRNQIPYGTNVGDLSIQEIIQVIDKVYSKFPIKGFPMK